MNRPFYAALVLLAFLALAMLAIRLSSRPSAQRPSAGSSSERQRRQPGVTTYVVVLPEAGALELLELVAEEREVAGPVICGLGPQRPAYSLGSALDGAAGEVHSAPYAWPVESLASSTRSSSLRAAIVEPAMFVRLEDAHSLTTGYDAAYDQAMAAEMPRHARSEAPAKQFEGIDADPMMLIFDSLARSNMPQAGPKSYWGKLRARRWDYEAQAILIGAGNRLWQVVAFAGAADEWTRAAEQAGLVDTAKANTRSGPTWAEYMAWIGSKQWSVARRDRSNTAGVAFWSEPGDRLLQIAVAGLNRVAELLHELIGQWMDEAEERLAERGGPASPALAPK